MIGASAFQADPTMIASIHRHTNDCILVLLRGDADVLAVQMPGSQASVTTVISAA